MPKKSKNKRRAAATVLPAPRVKHAKHAKRQKRSAGRVDVDAFLTDHASGIPTLVTPVLPPSGPFPEDRLSEDEVITALEATKPEREQLMAQLQELEDRTARLYKRYSQFRDLEMPGFGIDQIASNKDKRSIFDPIKYLKISARKAFGWAAEYNQSPEEAKQRSINAVLKGARKRYKDHKLIAPYLAKNTLPPELMDFIEQCTTEYAVEPPLAVA